MKPKLIITLLFISIASFAQFKPRGAFDYFAGGYNTINHQYIKTNFGTADISARCSYGSFRIRIGADYKMKNTTVYFDQHTYMVYGGGGNFTPIVIDYFVGVKYEIKENVKISFEHLCRHPIADSESLSRQFGGYDMISISYGY